VGLKTPHRKNQLVMKDNKKPQNYQVEGNEVGGACGANWGETERVLVIGKKTEGKGLLGSPRYRWIDNIKMDF
jgi:hypothetical protein